MSRLQRVNMNGVSLSTRSSCVSLDWLESSRPVSAVIGASAQNAHISALSEAYPTQWFRVSTPEAPGRVPSALMKAPLSHSPRVDSLATGHGCHPPPSER